jgi:hypothetical protein
MKTEKPLVVTCDRGVWEKCTYDDDGEEDELLFEMPLTKEGYPSYRTKISVSEFKKLLEDYSDNDWISAILIGNPDGDRNDNKASLVITKVKTK